MTPPTCAITAGAFRVLRSKNFRHPRKTCGDVAADRNGPGGMESAHSQLRSRLADGLRRNGADRLADINNLAG